MATLKLSSAELLRRRQALIRQGQKLAFTSQVKRPTKSDNVPIRSRNTPNGPLKHTGKFLKHFDPKQKFLDQKGPPIKANLAEQIPLEILLGHAVNITRRHMALKPDKLVRQVPTIDSPKSSHRATPRRAPEELTPAERKLFRKMAWYKPGFSK